MKTTTSTPPRDLFQSHLAELVLYNEQFSLMALQCSLHNFSGFFHISGRNHHRRPVSCINILVTFRNSVFLFVGASDVIQRCPFLYMCWKGTQQFKQVIPRSVSNVDQCCYDFDFSADRHHIISRGHLMPPEEPFFTADVEPGATHLKGETLKN